MHMYKLFVFSVLTTYVTLPKSVFMQGCAQANAYPVHPFCGALSKNKS
jgi:hypothetical protein